MDKPFHTEQELASGCVRKERDAQGEHERSARRSRRLTVAAISIPSAVAAVLLLFLIPVKTVDSGNRTSHDSSSEQLSRSYAEYNVEE